MENSSWLPSAWNVMPQDHGFKAERDVRTMGSRDQVVKGLLSDGARQSLLDISNRVSGWSGRFGDVGKAKLQPQVQLLHQQTDQQRHDTAPKQAVAAPAPDLGRRDWIDYDKLNEDDPQACSAYAQSIFQYLREAEHLKRAHPKYLEVVQTDVNSKMRAILVDWLVEVSEEYKLCADTLYQAVNYIDRFLSLQPVPRNQLQLVGVTCMWVAAKYEEIYPPNVADFCYITDNTYPKEQLVDMEEIVLKKLNYELTVPTAKTFLRRLLQVCNPDELLHFLSNYLTELSLLDYSMLGFLPSVIAAAGVYLANLMLKRQPWDANLRHYSTYVPSDISHCVATLAAVHQNVATSPNLAAIREKYAHVRYQQVSTFPPFQVNPYMFG